VDTVSTRAFLGLLNFVALAELITAQSKNKQEGGCLGGPKGASLIRTLSTPLASVTSSERALRAAL
jgi:hypothetical protein